MSTNPHLEDPRVQRTRARLHAAVLELAATEEGLSMARVARAAQVNRATVYRHYDNLDDLLVSAAESAVTAIAREHGAAAAPWDPERPPATMAALFRHVGSHRPLYQRLLGTEGSARFQDRLRRRVSRAMAALLPADLDDHTRDTLLAFGAGATVGMISALAADPDRDPDRWLATTWRHLLGLPGR